MRKPVIAGNWKMYKTIGQSVSFIEKLRPRVESADHCEVVVAPPFTALRAVAEAARDSNIRVGAQDVHPETEGAHTGDISAKMLLDVGCTYVIIGHSERRQGHAETDELVNRKLKTALASALVTIVCVGETLEQREAGETRHVLERQFRNGLLGLTAQDFYRIIIAYEPVWAIGTGRTATPELAAESHSFLRGLVAQKCGETVAGSIRILYGGSVKPENISGLMAQEGIDGALVGGASLQVESFSAIVNYPQA